MIEELFNCEDIFHCFDSIDFLYMTSSAEISLIIVEEWWLLLKMISRRFLSDTDVSFTLINLVDFDAFDSALDDVVDDDDDESSMNENDKKRLSLSR